METTAPDLTATAAATMSPAPAHRRSLLFAGGGAALALAAAACGSSYGTSHPKASSHPAAAHTSAAPSLVVKTAAKGHLGTILVDGGGMTLYHFDPDRVGAIACTGACASLWPPLLVPAGASGPSAGAGLSGGLGTTRRPEGTTQVTYDGMPLYHYAKDKDSGDSYGQGVGGKWWVVSPSGTSGGSSGGAGSSTTTTGGSGAYGY